jgi:hypothetical protein
MRYAKSLMLIVATVIVVLLAAYAAILYTGFSAVFVTNSGSQTISVTIREAGEYVGSARLRPRQFMVRAFFPHRDGDVMLSCRDESHRKAMEEHFGYVTGNMPTIYSFRVPQCTRMQENWEYYL